MTYRAAFFQRRNKIVVADYSYCVEHVDDHENVDDHSTVSSLGVGEQIWREFVICCNRGGGKEIIANKSFALFFLHKHQFLTIKIRFSVEYNDLEEIFKNSGKNYLICPVACIACIRSDIY